MSPDLLLALGKVGQEAAEGAELPHGVGGVEEASSSVALGAAFRGGSLDRC